MRYDLNLLRVFVALAEEGSVTRAADRVGVTQPALSASLARLRDLFKDPLFVRQRQGMLPTDKAAELTPRLAALLLELDTIVLGEQDFDPAREHRAFAIAANSFVEYALLPDIVREINRTAPGISLRILPFGADLIETGLVSGGTALVLGRVSEPPDSIVVQDLIRDGLTCVLRADHPITSATLSRHDYEALRHVNVLPAGRLRAGLFQALRQAGLRREIAVSVTHFSAIPDLIAETDFCATLPTLIWRRLKRDERLRSVSPPADLGTFPVSMAWHARHRNDPAHRWLRGVVSNSILSVAKP